LLFGRRHIYLYTDIYTYLLGGCYLEGGSQGCNNMWSGDKIVVASLLLMYKVSDVVVILSGEKLKPSAVKCFVCKSRLRC